MDDVVSSHQPKDLEVIERGDLPHSRCGELVAEAGELAMDSAGDARALWVVSLLPQSLHDRSPRAVHRVCPCTGPGPPHCGAAGFDAVARRPGGRPARPAQLPSPAPETTRHSSKSPRSTRETAFHFGTAHRMSCSPSGEYQAASSFGLPRGAGQGLTARLATTAVSTTSSRSIRIELISETGADPLGFVWVELNFRPARAVVPTTTDRRRPLWARFESHW